MEADETALLIEYEALRKLDIEWTLSIESGEIDVDKTLCDFLTCRYRQWLQSANALPNKSDKLMDAIKIINTIL